MPIAYIAHEAVINEGTSVTSTTVPTPAGVSAGDYLIAAIGTTGAGPVGIPSGWTRVEPDLLQGSVSYVLCYRLADGSEAASYSWTHDLGASAGLIAAYSGILQVAPSDSAIDGTTTDTTTQAMGSVTVPANGWLIYLPIDRRNSGAVAQSWSTSDAQDVRRGQASGDGGAGSVFSIALFDSDRVVLDVQERTITATETWSQMAAWSIAVAPNVQTTTPTGIAPSGSVGTPAVAAGAVSLTPTGSASNAALGEPDLLTAGEVSPEGIASQSVVGQPLLNPAIQPTGIASTTQVGTPSLERFTVTFTLYPPTIKQTPMAWNRLHARYSLIRGISIVQRQDGTYYTTQFPAQTELEEAQRFWLGGYEHPLSSAEALDLIDAGFGDYVTRETTPA